MFNHTLRLLSTATNFVLTGTRCIRSIQACLSSAALSAERYTWKSRYFQAPRIPYNKGGEGREREGWEERDNILRQSTIALRLARDIASQRIHLVLTLASGTFGRRQRFSPDEKKKRKGSQKQPAGATRTNRKKVATHTRDWSMRLTPGTGVSVLNSDSTRWKRFPMRNCKLSGVPWSDQLKFANCTLLVEIGGMWYWGWSFNTTKHESLLCTHIGTLESC